MGQPWLETEWHQKAREMLAPLCPLPAKEAKLHLSGWYKSQPGRRPDSLYRAWQCLNSGHRVSGYPGSRPWQTLQRVGTSPDGFLRLHLDNAAMEWWYGYAGTAPQVPQTPKCPPILAPLYGSTPPLPGPRGVNPDAHWVNTSERYARFMRQRQEMEWLADEPVGHLVDYCLDKAKRERDAVLNHMQHEWLDVCRMGDGSQASAMMRELHKAQQQLEDAFRDAAKVYRNRRASESQEVAK